MQTKTQLQPHCMSLRECWRWKECLACSKLLPLDWKSGEKKLHFILLNKSRKMSVLKFPVNGVYQLRFQKLSLGLWRAAIYIPYYLHHLHRLLSGPFFMSYKLHKLALKYVHSFCTEFYKLSQCNICYFSKVNQRQMSQDFCGLRVQHLMEDLSHICNRWK